MTRRVLLVAYFFPPAGGVPVPRVLALVRHLPRHGWAPIVLTPRDSGHPQRDDAIGDRIPTDARVVRTGIVEPGQLRRRLARRSDDDGESDDGGATATTLARRIRRRAVGRLRGTVGSLSRLVLFPDEQVGWLPFAFVSGFRAMRREHAQVIWSTSSPMTAHVVAGLLAAIGHRPWVADFRDPWVSSPRAPSLPRHQRWLRARLESWILRRADHVTFATPGLTRQYASRYPELGERFSTWLNGYDRGELDELQEGRDRASGGHQPGPYRLVFAGTPEARVLETFLAGLALAIRRGSLGSDQIRIEFIGSASVEAITLLAAWSRHPGHEGILNRRGFQPRAEALTALIRADAALVLVGDYPGVDLIIPVKVYEAIGLDRPVLAMTPPGDLRDVLEGLGWGIVVDPRPEAVADGLERIVAFPPASRRVDPDGRYDRAKLVEDIVRILEDVVRARQRSGAGRG